MPSEARHPLSSAMKSSELTYTDINYDCSRVPVDATSIHIPDDRCLCQSWALCCSQSCSLIGVLGQVKDLGIWKDLAETLQARSRRLGQGLATPIVCDQKVSCCQESMSHVALHFICKIADLRRQPCNKAGDSKQQSNRARTHCALEHTLPFIPVSPRGCPPPTQTILASSLNRKSTIDWRRHHLFHNICFVKYFQ